MIVNTIDKAPLVSAAAPVQDELAKQIGAEDLLRIIRATK